ncbi:MAG: hypothetical protein IKX76_06495 [Eubacterium sp.]|nr:hypothetical protein [Eubacterium sp.]
MNREDLKSIGMVLLVAVLAVVITFWDDIAGALSIAVAEQAGGLLEQVMR